MPPERSRGSLRSSTAEGATSGGPYHVEFHFVRAAHESVEPIEAAPGAPIASLLRQLGHAPEGCAVLENDRPIPLDTPIRHPGRFTVLSTFSGG